MTASRTVPPSRWLLLLTLAVVVMFTAWRVVAAASLDLRSDEAYYWTWSHQAVLSFLDQPPMVAWFERLGVALFGDTPLGARFAQLVILPLIACILGDIARRRTGHWNAALFVVLAMECTLNYGLFSIVVEPNLPLLLFSALMLWALVRLDETDDPRWWLLTGAAGGLALLSKYLVVLLAPAVLVFLLADGRHRRWLATVWPYAAVAIAVVLFSPVLVWNARHDWESFAFQSVRLGGGHGASAAGFWRFAMYETLWVGPVLVAACLLGAGVLLVRSMRRGDAAELMMAVAFLLPLLFLAGRSFTFQINQSWAWFAWPFGIVSLALALPWAGRSRAVVLIGAVAVTGLPLVAAFLFHATTDRTVWFGRFDPFGQDAGYTEMADAALAAARANGAGWIAATDYRTYANLQFHIGKDIPVIEINERSRFLDFAPVASPEGRALYVHPGPPSGIVAGATLVPLDDIGVSWRGVEMQRMEVDLLDGFVPELAPRRGTPAYAWSN